jgi:lysophospholipase L1-like esterase
MRPKILVPAMLLIHLCALTAAAKLVACVGDSITYGAGIADRLNDSYPAQLQRILQEYDPAWRVDNYGVSGATLLSRGDLPYIRQSAYVGAQTCHPDIVIIKLGTNDSKPQNWQYKSSFISDYSTMIDVFRSLPSRPQVWICKPVPAFQVNFSIRPEVIRDEILPMIDEIGKRKGVPVIDLYTALLDRGNLFPDAIHPNAEGAGIMARTLAPYLLGVRFLPDFNHDGVLNLVDFARLAQQWRGRDPSLDVAPPAADGIVSCEDLAGLSRYWMMYPGLVAHWPLDEIEGSVAADRLGHFEGMVHGSPVWQPQGGTVGGALEFDGIDDHVTAGNVLNPADGPFTVFAWIRSVQPGRAILSQSDQSGTSTLWLGTDAATGALMTTLTDGGRFTRTLVSTACVTDGAWRQVRLIWDGSCRYLYVDGQVAAADTRKLGKLKPSTAGLFVGVGSDLDAVTFWSGRIDDVRIYNRAVKP